MVGPENTIFDCVFRYPRAPDRGGPVGRVARVSPAVESTERGLALPFGIRSPLRVLRRKCRGGSPWASPIPPRLVEIGAGAVVRSMLLLENRLRFLTNSGWCTRTRSSCEILHAFTMKFACGNATPTRRMRPFHRIHAFCRESKPESAREARIYRWA